MVTSRPFVCVQGHAYVAFVDCDGRAEEAYQQDEDAFPQGQRTCHAARRRLSARVACRFGRRPLTWHACPCPSQWFAKAKRQAQLAWSRGKSAKYDPLADPKYSLTRDVEEETDEADTPTQA